MEHALWQWQKHCVSGTCTAAAAHALQQWRVYCSSGMCTAAVEHVRPEFSIIIMMALRGALLYSNLGCVITSSMKYAK